MEIINFEDGQLVSPAHVTIDGVKHEVTPAVCEGNTPLSSYNLNRMQEKIIEDGIIVSPTEPTIDRRKVWMKKGKNLFDKNELKSLYYWQCTGTIDSNKKIELSPVSTNGVAFAKTNESIELNAGDYSFSASFEGNLSKIRIMNSNDQEIASSTNNNLTFTLQSKTKFHILFYINNSNLDNYLNIENIQIEQGSTVTTYEAYIEPAIYIKNNNDVYEEFRKKEEDKINEVERKLKEIESNLEIKQANDLFVTQSGYTLSDTNVFRQGKHYFGNIIIKKDSGTFTYTSERVATLSKTVKGIFNNGCFLNKDKWQNQNVGYCYITENNVLIADCNSNGCNFAKIHIDLVVE